MKYNLKLSRQLKSINFLSNDKNRDGLRNVGLLTIQTPDLAVIPGKFY
jgi:hypothetical protein